MIEVGFELEYGSHLPQKEVLSHLRTIIPEMGKDKRSRFRVSYEPSLAFDELYCNEIQTPVYPLKTGIKVLRSLCGYIYLSGGQTNFSCGLHVNLGFREPEKTAKIDPLRLILLANERGWLKTFRRTTNAYCVPLHRRICKNVSIDSVYYHLNNERDHHDAISFDKLKENKGKGYVEFRIIGNSNYHHRLAEIETAIAEFAFALKHSTTDKHGDLVAERAKGLNLKF